MGFVEPAKVVSHFHVRPGDKVGDFGAGSGHFTKALSREVGEGKVYAVEIQRGLAEALGEMARREHLTNVESLWGDLERDSGVKIGDGTLDMVLLSNTLFLLENKEGALKEAARTLRKGGKLIIIDWTESFGSMGPAEHMVFREADARTLAERMGYTYERSFEAGAHHYGLTFRKN